jgi:hypothetical protein
MTNEEKHDSQIQEMLSLRKSESFGPFFAERVIHQIKTLHQEVEYQLFSFFKKYQLVALGVIIALLVLNIMLSDTLSIQSILGFEENNKTEIVQIDLYQGLTE